MATISETYKLVRHGEVWKEIDGQWQATHTDLIFEENGQFFYAITMLKFGDYKNPGDIPVEAIINKTVIPIESYAPEVKSWYTVTSPVAKHVKRTVLSYLNVAAVVTKIEGMEKLREKSHSNIVKYFGCEVENARVVGLCLEDCGQSLKQLCSPNHYNKKSAKIDWSTDDINKCIDPIESAARHLHVLGLVHNDINLSNIMCADRPVLIDFGSYRPIGEEAGGGTFEWHDESVTHCTPKNDLDALQEIREWLSAKNHKTWLFGE